MRGVAGGVGDDARVVPVILQPHQHELQRPRGHGAVTQAGRRERLPILLPLHLGSGSSAGFARQHVPHVNAGSHQVGALGDLGWNWGGR